MPMLSLCVFVPQEAKRQRWILASEHLCAAALEGDCSRTLSEHQSTGSESEAEKGKKGEKKERDLRFCLYAKQWPSNVLKQKNNNNNNKKHLFDSTSVTAKKF